MPSQCNVSTAGCVVIIIGIAVVFKIKIPEIIERDIKCFLSTWFQFLLLCLTLDSVIFEKPENHGKHMII
jgi:hypothetical protein